MDKLNIQGIKVKTLKIIPNVKGDVLHMLRNDDSDFTSFGECYFSEVIPFNIKGWKKHTTQNQNISVPVGLLKIVLFDDRKESKTFKKIDEIFLGRPDFYFRVSIPPGIFYSFKCISENAALIVNCSDIPHNYEESVTLELSNPYIPYNWN